MPPSEDQNTTPAASGNDGTTPPAAETAGTTPQPEGGNETQQPDIDKIVQKRLDRERKKWEADAEERAKRARMDEAERLKAELADKDKEIATAKAEAANARQVAALTGKVVDAGAALKLLDPERHLAEDGTVNTTALLTDYPFLKPATPGVVIGGANPRGQKDPTLMSDEEFFNSRTKKP